MARFRRKNSEDQRLRRESREKRRRLRRESRGEPRGPSKEELEAQLIRNRQESLGPTSIPSIYPKWPGPGHPTADILRAREVRRRAGRMPLGDRSGRAGHHYRQEREEAALEEEKARIKSRARNPPDSSELGLQDYARSPRPPEARTRRSTLGERPPSVKREEDED